MDRTQAIERATPRQDHPRTELMEGTFPYRCQEIDGKDMAKMIIYLMDRHYPTRNLDALVEALEVAAFRYEFGYDHEYYHDWKWLLQMFQSIQAHNNGEK